jgi:hypothetical protein
MTTRPVDGARPLVRFLLSVSLLLVVTSIPAAAQNRSGPIEEVRAPEVFAHIGRFRAGSDEGSIGQAASYGATFTAPIARRFAVDLDYQTSRVTRTNREFTYRTRRTLIVPSLLYRFGRERVSGFVGGGIGAELDRSTYTGGVESDMSDRNRLTSFRGGVVAFPTRKLGLRGELYMAGWHLGARIGVGYRFN